MNSSLNKISANYYTYLKQSIVPYDLSPSKGILTSDGITVQIDQKEYGIPKGAIPIRSVEFCPRELGILDKYKDDKLLYHEMISSTKVYLSQDLTKDQKVIKKTIQKDKLINPLALRFAKQECQIHSQMMHDNVVEMYEYTESKDDYILFLEYCDKADYLANKILECHTPIENNDKLMSYATDILQGLSYVHSQGVIHDDIKLENILMQSSERDDEFNQIKLCDFGLSQILDPHNSYKVQLETKCGTLGYIAPEAQIKAWIGPEVDMWSFGVVLYELSVAYKPTVLGNYRYGSGPIPFRRIDWRKRGQHLQDLIQSCLEINPEKRITSDEALQHPWFTEECSSVV